MSYTPINTWKVKSKDGKEFLKIAKQMSLFAIANISVPTSIFDDLIESISPSERKHYFESIPFEGKLLVRK